MSCYKVMTNWIAGYGNGIESYTYYRSITLTSLIHFYYYYH